MSATKPDPIKPIGTDAFVDHVRDDCYNGFGFVPFIGSGLSSGSGILTGQLFTEYLAYTTYRCVAKPDGKEFGQKSSRWDLKRSGWPDYPKRDEVDQAKRWIMRHFEVVATRSGYVVVYGLDDAGDKIEQLLDRSHEAIWRAAGDRAHPKYIAPDAHTPNPLPTAPLALNLRRPLVPKILEGASREEDTTLRNLIASLSLTNKLREFQGEPGTSRTSEDFITERAIRALYDWRATLLFLSELKLEHVKYEEGSAAHLLRLEQAQTSVIDGFNIHITRGRKPNLGHHMLAHLARPLRMRTILSTNFDSLLEQAFDSVNEPLSVFSVSNRGGLPSAGTVRGQNSIVKLHGGLLETRADFSLDDPPTTEDKDQFVRYLLEPAEAALPMHRMVPNRLLVAGYSASDMRCVAFIKHALDCDPYDQARVYWICHTEADVKWVGHLFAEYRGRVILVQTQRTDLLFYEIYQRITLALPPGGFSFQFTYKVPPGRNPNPVMAPAHDPVDSEIEEIVSAIVNGSAPALAISDQLVLKQTPGRWYVLDGSCMVDTAARVYSKLQGRGLNCIWTEMQDFPNAASMLHDVLKTIAVRLGLFQSEHTELCPVGPQEDYAKDETTFKERLARLFGHFGIQTNQWVVFLYGRTVPGGCSGWANDFWDQSKYSVLERTLNALASPVDQSAGRNISGLRVVYLPFSSRRFACHRGRVEWIQERICEHYGVATPVGEHRASHRDEEGPIWLDAACARHEGRKRTVREFRAFQTNSVSPPPDLTVVHAFGEATLPPPDLERENQRYCNIIRDLLEKWLPAFWAGAQSLPLQNGFLMRRLQFLYGLCLFRQSRHPNALLTDAVYRCPHRFNLDGIDNDWEREQTTARWLKELREKNVLLVKPGGYAWMYRDMRMGLLRLIESRISVNVSADGQYPLNFAGQLRGRMHFWIGDWYFKAFCATGHITPLVESLHHRFEAMRFCRYDKRWGQDLEDPESVGMEQIVAHRVEYFRMSLCSLIKTVRISRPWLRYWMFEPGDAGIFTRPRLDEGEAETIGGMKAWDKHPLCILANHIIDEFNSEGVMDSRVAPLRQLIRALVVELDAVYRMLHGETGVDSVKHPALKEVPVDYENQIAGFRNFPRQSTNEAPIDQPNRWDLSFDPVATVQSDDYRAGFLNWFGPKRLKLDELERCLADLDNVPNVEKTERQSSIDIATKAFVKARRAWIWQNSHNQPTLQAYLQLLTEFAYLHIKRAKIEGHAGIENVKAETVRVRYLQVSFLCNEALRICPLLDPFLLELELSERIKALTLYALALAHLGRFFEAHRHLNEAQAFLTKRALTIDPTALAKIQLRRAETYLTEARCLKLTLEGKSECPPSALKMVITSTPEHQGSAASSTGGTNLRRLMCAKIDDAWVCLESVERLLSGRSHSSLWWGRWVALSLRAYGASVELRRSCEGSHYVSWESLAFRRRIEHSDQIWRLYNMGRLLSHGDVYRILRLMDYCHKALGVIEDRVQHRDIQRLFFAEWQKLKVGEISSDKVGGDSSLLGNYKSRLDGLIESSASAV